MECRDPSSHVDSRCGGVTSSDLYLLLLILFCVTVQHIWGCNLISPSALPPFFCSRVTWKPKLFHRNHMLGTMDFTVSEHQVPFHRVHAVLKSPWILGKSWKSPWIPFFLETSLNFCASPWKVLEFSSTLNVVAWKDFFDAFWLSKTEYKSLSSESLKVIYIKCSMFYAIINWKM